MPPCHTGEETYGKKDDVLLVVQKEGMDRFHCRARTFPPYRREERGPDRGMGLARTSNSACGGGRSVLALCFSQITFRLISLSIALGGSGDLFDYARDLFVETKPLWGSINGGSNAARKSGKDDYDKLSLPTGSGFPEDFLQ